MWDQSYTNSVKQVAVGNKNLKGARCAKQASKQAGGLNYHWNSLTHN